MTNNNFDFGQRLRLSVESTRLKYNEFAEKSGVKPNALSNYLNNVSRPNYDILGRFTKILGVTSDYLLGFTDSAQGSQPGPARGEALLSEVAEAAASYGRSPGGGPAAAGLPALAGDAAAQLPAVAMVDAAAAARYLELCAEPGLPVRLPLFTFPGVDLSQGTFRGFQVADEAMAPTLQAGDWVLARQVPALSPPGGPLFDLGEAQVYVVVTRSGVLIKRLGRPAPAGEALLLQADNLAFASLELPVAEVLEVWEVKSRISTLLTDPDTAVKRTVQALEQGYQELRERLEKLEGSAGKKKQG